MLLWHSLIEWSVHCLIAAHCWLAVSRLSITNLIWLLLLVNDLLDSSILHDHHTFIEICVWFKANIEIDNNWDWDSGSNQSIPNNLLATSENKWINLWVINIIIPAVWAKSIFLVGVTKNVPKTCTVLHDDWSEETNPKIRFRKSHFPLICRVHCHVNVCKANRNLGYSYTECGNRCASII